MLFFWISNILWCKIYTVTFKYYSFYGRKETLLKGKIHLAVFYFTISKSILYILTWTLIKGNKAILIYLISQLIFFGVSSTYHTTTWKDERAEYLVRLIDHISIFILIYGAQISVVLLLLPYTIVSKTIVMIS